MPAIRSNTILQCIRGMTYPASASAPTNGQLLGRFVDGQDQAAFTELVRSLGPMVWGICQRILANTQDAEDAFQSTFIVLSRKATEVRPREAVADWLHGVARRAALQARRVRSARRTREVQVADPPDQPAPSRESEPDLREVLDTELSQLPDDERAVLVVCDLASQTRREAALELGWPEGTVAGRLARARERLRARLIRRGFVVSGTGLTAALAGPAASAAIPTGLLQSTIASAMAAPGTEPQSVVVLLQEVLRAMVRAKQFKFVTIVTLLVGCSGFGMFLHESSGQGKPLEPAAVVPLGLQTTDLLAPRHLFFCRVGAGKDAINEALPNGGPFDPYRCATRESAQVLSPGGVQKVGSIPSSYIS